jgi:hypothetical protein
MNPDFSQPPVQKQPLGRDKKPFFTLPGCLLGVVMILILWAILFPVYGGSLYISENDNHFPNAMTWHDAINPYTKNKEVFLTPLTTIDGLKTTVAMNSGLSKVSESEIAEASKTVLIFLSTQTRPSPHGGKESLAVIQNETVMIGYADTSVKYLKIDAMVDLVWLPEPEKGAK